MPDYIVKKPCRPVNEFKTPGDGVTLTERQAKYLVMSGHLRLKSGEPALKKTSKKPGGK